MPMRVLGWVWRVLLFVGVLWLALRNTHDVPFHVPGAGQVLSYPLIVLLLGSFVLGAVAGLLILLPSLLARRRRTDEPAP